MSRRVYNLNCRNNSNHEEKKRIEEKSTSEDFCEMGNFEQNSSQNSFVAMEKSLRGN